MTRRSLFTEHLNLMMHLSSIGSVCVGAELSTNLAFDEQEVTVITLDLVPEIGRESLLMVKEAGFEVEVMDFTNGQLVFVPLSDGPPDVKSLH